MSGTGALQQPCRILTSVLLVLVGLAASSPLTISSQHDATSSSNHLVRRQSSSTASSYDYIVVGGGTAGLLLAYRLALANGSSASVLVLEDGSIPEETSAPASYVPAAVMALQGSPADFSLRALRGQGAQTASAAFAYPQGRGLGGSSAINYMTYTTGSQQFYDDLAQRTNDSSWSWQNMAPLLARSTKSSSSQVTSNSSTGGLSLVNNLTTAPLHSELQATMSEVFGVAAPEHQYTIQGTTGFRDSAWTGIGQRGWGELFNLVVTTQTRVERVVFDASADGASLLRASGVVAYSQHDNATVTYAANRRVILSAGFAHSPALLLASGIGDNATVARVANSTRAAVSLPAVGVNLQDHPRAELSYRISNPAALSSLSGSPDDAAEPRQASDIVTAQDVLLHADPVQLIGNQPLGLQSPYAWAHTRPMVWTKSNVTFTSPSSNGSDLAWPDVEISLSPVNISSLHPNNTVAFTFSLLSSASRGSISFAPSSSGVQVDGIITGALTDPRDRAAAVWAFRAVRRMAMADRLSPLGLTEISPGGLALPSDASEDAILAWLEENVGSAYSGCCTARQGPSPWMESPENSGAVDSNFQVHGTSNLHVVDMSILPEIVPAHPQALAYAIGEKGAIAVIALDNMPPSN